MRIGSHPTIITTAIIAIAWFLLILPPQPILTLMADTDQYRWMSASITSGTFLNPIDLSQAPHLAAVMRPPLFPLLIALADAAPLLSPPHSLVALHLCVALIVLVGAPYALRNVYAPPVTAVATGLALYSAKQVVWAEMSEWLALSFLLGAAITYLRWASHPTRLSAALVAALLSLAILTRTALLPFMVILPAIVLQTPRPLRRGIVFSLAIGVLPLGIWAWAQSYRVGSFTLGAYEGLNVLATVRSLQTLSPPPHTTPETVALIDFINRGGVTTGDAGLLPKSVHTWDGEFYAAFHKNFDLVCEGVKAIAPASPPAALSLATYTIWSEPRRYLEFLRGGAATLLSDYALLLVSCALTAVWAALRSKGSTPTSRVTLTLCGATLLYLVSTFASILWLHRYFLPVQSVVVFLTTLSFASLVGSFRPSRDTTAT